MIRTLVVDDEAPARDRLRTMLADFPDVRVVGEAADGEEALERIAELHPTLVLLDIQMPGRTGLEVAATLPVPRPRIVFCTAFDRYALDAFDQHAVDYILKPATRVRLARAIDRVRESLGDDDRLHREMAEASVTQARLLPQGGPAASRLDYAGACHPAREVGGDYYDFILLPPRRIGLAVVDVSGKGMYAALLMASLQARLQVLAPRHGDQVAPLVSEIDRLLFDSTAANKYATLFYAVFDDETCRLTYANAGHVPALVIRGSAPAPGAVMRLMPTGPVVGLLDDARFEQRTVDLVPGDVLLITTDGITEAVEDAGEDPERWLTTLALGAVGASAAELRDRILHELARLTAGCPPADDRTLVTAVVKT